MSGDRKIEQKCPNCNGKIEMFLREESLDWIKAMGGFYVFCESCKGEYKLRLGGGKGDEKAWKM